MKTYYNQETRSLATSAINNSITVAEHNNTLNLNSVNFTDLRPGTQYHFTIVAYTNVGPGPESMILVSTLPDGNHTIKYYKFPLKFCRNFAYICDRICEN